MEAARELDFRPNLVARGLVTSRTSTLGVIVHDIADPYFGEIVRGLEDRAREDSYRVFVCSSDRNPDRELGYVETLIGHRVEALVFAGGAIGGEDFQEKTSRILDKYRADGGLVVSLAPTRYAAAWCAIPDNRSAVAAMTNYLLELGHVQIAFVNGPELVLTSHVRQAGYEDAIRATGREPDPVLMRRGTFTVEGGESAVNDLLTEGIDFTAIVAANDLMAFGVLRGLANRGVDVPKDVSVAGIDDIYLAACVRPALTTVRLEMYELGRRGAALALRQGSDGQSTPGTLSFSIVERESAGPPPGLVDSVASSPRVHSEA